MRHLTGKSTDGHVRRWALTIAEYLVSIKYTAAFHTRPAEGQKGYRVENQLHPYFIVHLLCQLHLHQILAADVGNFCHT